MLPNEYQHGCEQKEFSTCSTIESVNNKYLHPPPPPPPPPDVFNVCVYSPLNHSSAIWNPYWAKSKIKESCRKLIFKVQGCIGQGTI